QATNTIINDDGPTISIYSASVNEGNSGVSQMNFTVMLSTTSAVPVTVSYASSDNGSSTAGSDYQAVSGLLTFAPGQTSQTISVNVLGDTLYEGNETFYLRISDGTNGTVGTTNYLGIGTINNDDAAPALTINDVSLTVGNTGSTNATFTISLSAASGLGVGVYYNTIAGTATSGTDYFSTSNYLFIPAGQTSATVSIGVLGDTLKEANETFIVNLYNPSNATLARSQGTATIMDDDPNGAIELSPAVTGEAIDYTGSGVFTVAFVNNTNVSVRRYFSPGTGQPYDDRGLFEYNLAAVAGQQTGSVLLRVYENSFASASQQILVYGYAGDGAISTADGSSRGVLLGSFDPKGGTGWRVVALDLAGVQSLLGASGFLGIRLVGTFDGNTSISTSPNSNNQPLVDFVPGTPPTVPNLSVSDPSVVEGSTAGFTSAMTFTLTLSQASATPVTVTYQFADGTATVAGGDYSPPSYTIIFNAGETQKTVDVKVWQDSAIEADETFMFQVTGAANAAIVKGTGTGTIINDDFPVVSVAPATVTEGNSGVSYAAFTISLSAPSPQSVSVSYATSDIVSVAGPPGNYATAGVDYQATSGTATFAPGQTTVTVLVPVFGDTAVEPDELFAFGLSNPVHGRFVNYTYVSGATIANDDVPAVSVADATVAEGNNGTTAVTFTVTLDQAGLAPVTVNYQTADGTATAGSDYQAASGTLTFNPGQSQKTITVLVNGDTLAENGETFFVNLSSVSGGTLAQGQATGTIDNDDHAPVANAGPDQTADEATVVTFDANGSSDADNDTLTFTWNFGDGGSDSGVAPTHTFSDNGIYTVTLTASDGVNTSASTMTVTVANVAPISFVSGPVDGVRGQQRDFTFSATDVSAPDQAASFSYQIDWGDGTTQTVEGPASGSSVAHVYADTGSYAVSVTATDKDSGVSSVATAAVTIASVQLQGGDLYIGGTTGDDQIIVQPADASGGLEIFINGEDQGTFTPTGKVVVFGQAGDDVIQLAALPTADGGSIPFTSAAVVFGGDGNDTIDASGASAGVILVGGAGNDTLLGGSGSDVLIGGSGADTLHGGAGDDLLVGGASAYDANLLALALLSSEWSRTDADYQTRIDHLNGTAVGGINGNVVLDGQSVFADGVPADVWGEAGQDWFVLAGGTIPDRANDLEIGESVTSL
ncbi:MAG TPA: Calx-beta domain-containing protein, partial [Gemmataceae bacterium]|nr:Calx-beta domain-containing protein [Gemmataceae bacterium]